MERDRHEPLLGAVVQVALDPPPLGIAGRDDARARFGQVPHRLAKVGDVADDGEHLVRTGGARSHLEVALVARVRGRGYSTVASLPDSSAAATQLISRSAISGGSRVRTFEPTTMSGGFASFETSPSISRYVPSAGTEQQYRVERRARRDDAPRQARRPRSRRLIVVTDPVNASVAGCLRRGRSRFRTCCASGVPRRRS